MSTEILSLSTISCLVLNNNFIDAGDCFRPLYVLYIHISILNFYLFIQVITTNS